MADTKRKQLSFSDWLVFRLVPGLAVVALCLYLFFHAAVWTVTVFTPAPGPTWQQTLDALLRSPTNPAAGYPFDPGPAWVIYTITGLLVAGAIVAAALLAEARRTRRATKDRRAKLPNPAQYASIRKDRAVGYARESLEEVIKHVTPAPEDDDLVVPLGQLGRLPRRPDGTVPKKAKPAPGTPLFAQHEDTLCVIATPRSGKTRSLAAPRVIDAKGPVLATSTKADLALLTAVNRKRRGETLAFDPDGVLRWPHPMRPDFVHGAEDPAEALQRGKAWASGSMRRTSGGGSGNSEWFAQRAGEALAFLLHAAAVKPGGGSMADVVRWSADFQNPEPIEILDNSPAVANVQWGRRLAQLTQSRAGETTDSLAMTLSGVLSPLQSPKLLDLLCPAPHERFDVKSFLQGPNTVYFLDQPGSANAGPLITMLIDQILRTAQQMSQHAPGERLWPAFRVVLDEAANMAVLEQLDSVMADSGGRGIEVDVFFQNFAQMEQRWGKDAAEAIRASSTARLFLGGITEQDRARELSDAMGEYDAERVTKGNGGESKTTERRAILESAEIRQMHPGEGLLFYRNLPGTIITLPTLKAHPRYKAEIYPDYLEALRLTGRSQSQMEEDDVPDAEAGGSKKPRGGRWLRLLGQRRAELTPAEREAQAPVETSDAPDVDLSALAGEDQDEAAA